MKISYLTDKWILLDKKIYKNQYQAIVVICYSLNFKVQLYLKKDGRPLNAHSQPLHKLIDDTFDYSAGKQISATLLFHAQQIEKLNINTEFSLSEFYED